MKTLESTLFTTSITYEEKIELDNGKIITIDKTIKEENGIIQATFKIRGGSYAYNKLTPEQKEDFYSFIEPIY